MIRLVSALIQALLVATWVGLAIFNMERGVSSWLQWSMAALMSVAGIYIFTKWNNKQG